MRLRGLQVGLLVLVTGCVRLGFDSAPGAGVPAADDGAETADRLEATIANPVHSLAAPPSAPSTYTAVIGIQGKSGSYLSQLELDPTDRVTSSRLLALDLGGSSLRGLALLDSGDVLAGHGFMPVAQRLASASLATESKLDLVGVDNLHGMCVLPGGNLVVGEFGTGAGNRVVEFRPTNGGFVAERPVFTSTLGGGSLSSCAAASDTELYIVEYGAMDDADGDVVRLVLQDGGWTETHRFDTSSFAVDRYGPEHHTAVYSIVLHDSGWLYIFPLRRHGNRVRGLIRCPTPDITAAGCQELGALPDDTTTALDGPDAIQGAAQIPGSDDLLFATNRRIYRYHLATDTWTALVDLWSLDWPSGVTPHAVRNLLLQPG